ncbi:hypothetical protein Q4S01_20075, partial [Morganella morganii]
ATQHSDIAGLNRTEFLGFFIFDLDSGFQQLTDGLPKAQIVRVVSVALKVPVQQRGLVWDVLSKRLQLNLRRR